MKPCPVCEAGLNDSQQTCHKCGFMFAFEPSKGEKPKVIVDSPMNVSPLVSAFLCIATLAVVVFLFSLPNRKTPSSPPAETKSYINYDSGQASSKPDTAGVFACAKTQLQRILIAPRSAEFPWVHTDAITQKLNDGTYMVSSYLDAQNGFGAMIRQDYICKVRFNSLDDCSADCSIY